MFDRPVELLVGGDESGEKIPDVGGGVRTMVIMMEEKMIMTTKNTIENRTKMLRPTGGRTAQTKFPETRGKKRPRTTGDCPCPNNDSNVCAARHRTRGRASAGPSATAAQTRENPKKTSAGVSVRGVRLVT